MDRAELERWVASSEKSLANCTRALAEIRATIAPDSDENPRANEVFSTLASVLEEELVALDKLQGALVGTDALGGRAYAVRIQLIALLMDLHLAEASTQPLH